MVRFVRWPRAGTSILLGASFSLAGAAGLWAAALLFTTDRRVPPGDIRRFKHVVAVFPHADDETVTCGGTLHRFAASGALVTLVVLTGGERGNPAGIMQPALADRRRAEAERAASVLGVAEVVHARFGDGELAQHVDELTAYIGVLIEHLRPDLLITYDLAGFDGHSDHVACANAVTGARRTSFPDVALWYVTLPRRVLSLLRAVGQLVTSDAVETHRAPPTLRLFIGPGVAAKLHALRAYESLAGGDRQRTRQVRPNCADVERMAARVLRGGLILGSNALALGRIAPFGAIALETTRPLAATTPTHGALGGLRCQVSAGLLHRSRAQVARRPR